MILFDEATSALDNETQDKIQKAIDNMKNEYTILIIAHRLSTIINADRILYLEDGKIMAEGTHKELLKTCPSYKKLYETEINKENNWQKQGMWYNNNVKLKSEEKDMIIKKCFKVNLG